ncbi:MAG: CheR family methyltransferase [bacterium]
MARVLSETTPLSDYEYKLISGLIYEKFGINLSEQKKSLIVGRLQKVLRENGCSSFRNYYNYVTSDATGQALDMLINRISTNHTFFYRENDHFEFLLETVLPAIRSLLKQSGRTDLRIWCAGCSSGEEAYTLAIIVLEFFGRELSFWDTGILATDISKRVLEKAMAGIYSDENTSHIPSGLKHKYFKRQADGSWMVQDRVKEMILFRRFNLTRDDFPFKGQFQVIFCRNVMIYFDITTRNKLVNQFFCFTEPGGYLFVGHSESLGRRDCPYCYVKPSIYRKELVT